jgi:hypothetical protein
MRVRIQLRFARIHRRIDRRCIISRRELVD